MKARVRRRVRRPPDLTSLFDVLFIVVFVALIRAAAAQQGEAAALAKLPAPAPAPPPPVVADVAVLRARALTALTGELAARVPVVVRIGEKGVLERIELADRRLALDTPLLVHDPDPRIRKAYRGDRAIEARICKLVAHALGVPDLARHLLIFAPPRALADLDDALASGLERDVARCDPGVATIVPALAAPPSQGTSP